MDIKEEIQEVDVNSITVNPYQPRREFSPEELEGLAQSIRSVGLLHPPLVRPLPESDSYEIISGERRYRAACLVGMKRISVIVRSVSCSLSAQAALIENIQRVDLNPLEIAKALQQLMLEFNLTQDQLSQRIGKKRSTVANYLRLLSLPKNIQDSVSQGCISMGHAKAILAVEDLEKQQFLHESILRNQLSVRETEEAAFRIGKKTKKWTMNDVPRDFYLEQLAEKIQQKLGTKVLIQGQGKRGRILIHYYSLDDLDRVLSMLDVSHEG
jgi:ParB family chromosome partitioning protein